MLVEITNKREKKSLSVPDHIEHYLEQKRQSEIERLGANIGDTVFIIWPGNGCYIPGFNCSMPHKITNVDPSGFVEFDHGAAISLRPDVFRIY